MDDIDYNKLNELLIKQSANDVTLSFEEIESITGIKLPSSAEKAQWWRNIKKSKRAQIWLNANYMTVNVNKTIIETPKCIRFRKIGDKEQQKLDNENNFISKVAYNIKEHPALVIFGFIATIISLIISLDSKFNSNENINLLEQNTKIEQRGNTVGNIANSGHLAQQGDWVYYSNYNDGDKLYKMHVNGFENTKLNEDRSRSINIIDDWIYYSNDSDNGKLYKIRIDGTNKTSLNDDESYFITVIDDWIYYISTFEDDLFQNNFYIYKIRTDGTDRTLINDTMSLRISVVDGWIYYYQVYGVGGICKMRTDGTGKITLDDVFSLSFNIIDDWVYYGAGDTMYKMRTDGTRKTYLIDDFVDNINVVGDWIYYSISGGGLYKISTDGNNRTKISDDWVTSINIIGDWIYYFSYNDIDDDDDYPKPYMIRTDGTERQPVVDIPIMPKLN